VARLARSEFHRRTKLERAKHVVFGLQGFSDGGSTPPASKISRSEIDRSFHCMRRPELARSAQDDASLGLQRGELGASEPGDQRRVLRVLRDQVCALSGVVVLGIEAGGHRRAKEREFSSRG
jgi:hypothetical protein